LFVLEEAKRDWQRGDRAQGGDSSDEVLEGEERQLSGVPFRLKVVPTSYGGQPKKREHAEKDVKEKGHKGRGRATESPKRARRRGGQESHSYAKSLTFTKRKREGWEGDRRSFRAEQWASKKKKR